MSLDLKWEKLRPEPVIRVLLDCAVVELNQVFGVKSHIIRHPFGKIIACRAGGLWFFHTGDGGRPPQLWTLAVVTGPEPKSLFPGQRSGDFSDCCGLLGFRSEAEMAQFWRFLFPNPGRARMPTVQGAS